MDEKIKKILQSFIVGICIFIVSFANLPTKPFGLAFYLAAYLTSLTYISAPFYLLGAVLNDPTYIMIGVSAIICLITICSELIIKNKSLLKVRIVIAIGCLLISTCIKGIISHDYSLALYLAFVIIGTFCAFNFLYPKKYRFKPCIYEATCGFICIALTVCGLTSMKLPIPLEFFLFSFFMYFLSYATPFGGLCLALSFGIGMDIASQSILYTGYFAAVCAFALIFRTQHKAIYVFTGTLAFIAINFYLYNINIPWFNITSYVIGGIIFCCVPNKCLFELKSVFDITQSRLGVRHMLNKNKKDISMALNKSSIIFNKMEQIMKEMVNKKNQINDTIEKVVKETQNTVCSNCSKYAECKSNNLNNSLNDFVSNTLMKERVSVLDIPQSLMNQCNNISKIITIVSEYNEKARKLIEEKKTIDVSRKLIAEQLGGMSKILYNMSIKEGKPFGNNTQKEKIIMDELQNHNIICSEVFVNYDEEEPNVTLIVLRDSINTKRIEKSISNIMRIKMRVDSIDDAFVNGWSIITVLSCPKYDVVFSCAHKALHEVCGDVHSFIKIHNDKFMMALSDGMGSGKKAAQISDIAITLVENFYKAGFDSPLILDSVNKFLALSSEESYSAVDIVTVDLSTGQASVIKIGSPDTYIRSEESTEIIEGGALPLGMLEEMRPLVSVVNLKHSDMVLLVTDGIADNFQNSELANIINNIDSLNTETVAKSIIKAAIDKCDKMQKDDMSVAVLRVVEV